MAVTPLQIQQALVYTALFKLFQTSPPVNSIGVTDATNWLAIGVDTGGGDTIDYLYKIQDPAGIPIYENSGFNAGDFSSPDTNSLANILLNLAGTKPVTGTYVLSVKVKVVDGGTEVLAEKDLSFLLAKSLTCIKAKVEITFDCKTAIAKSTDTTNYNASGYSIISNARVHTLYPPDTSGQSDATGSGEIVTHTDLLAPAPYESDFTNDVVYRTVDNLVTVNVHFYAKTAETSSCDDVLCKMFCCLKKLEDKYSELVRNPTEQRKAWELLMKGIVYYDLAVAGRTCGNETKVTYYAKKFYDVTGCDPNCDCCDDVAPVIPCGGCECTDGEDGREVEMQVVTSGSDKIFQWRYVGTVGWTTLTTISPVAGTPGADGVAVLISDFSGLATQGTAFESLLTGRVPYSLPANKLSTNQSKAKVRTIFKSTANPNPTQLVRLTFNTTPTNTPLNIGFKSKTTTKIILETILTRISNTILNVEQTVYFCDDSIGGHSVNTVYVQTPFQIAALDLAANAYDIDAQGNSDVIGDILLESCEIIYFKK